MDWAMWSRWSLSNGARSDGDVKGRSSDLKRVGSDAGLNGKESELSAVLRGALSSPGIVALGTIAMPVDLPAQPENTPPSKRSSRTSLANGSLLASSPDSWDDSGPREHKKSLSNGTNKDLSLIPSGRIQTAASQIKNFLSPNYKTRADEFRKLFPKIPDSEKFVIDYGCAFQREILVHGRLYLSQQSACFYANIFKWETTFVLNYKDVASVTKERTAKVIPNAIQLVTTSGEKYFFTSFGSRDKSYMALFKLWQSALLDQVMSPVELWEWAQCSYDRTHLPPSSDEDDTDHMEGEWLEDEEMKGGEGATFTVGASGPDSEFPPSKKTKKNTHADIEESSEIDEEVSCPCASHEGVELLNKVYPLSVDQMFILLFTDSPFFRDFQDYRNASNNQLEEWKIEEATGKKSREVRFTLNLNHSMGPKSTEVYENQTYEEGAKSSGVYVVRCEATNSGIPYADSFSVLTTYCLTRVSENASRIRAHGCPLFKKSIWGIVKSFIEKNTSVGIVEHFTDLDTCLRRECSRLGLPSGGLADGENLEDRPKGPKKGQRAHNLTGATPDEPLQPTPIHGPLSPSPATSRSDNLVKLLMILMIALLFLNLLLYWRIWSNGSSEPRLPQLSLSEIRRLLERSSLGKEEAEEMYSKFLTAGRQRWESTLADTQSALAQTVLVEMERELGSLRASLASARGELADVLRPLPRSEL